HLLPPSLPLLTDPKFATACPDRSRRRPRRRSASPGYSDIPFPTALSMPRGPRARSCPRKRRPFEKETLSLVGTSLSRAAKRPPLFWPLCFLLVECAGPARLQRLTSLDG